MQGNSGWYGFLYPRTSSLQSKVVYSQVQGAWLVLQNWCLIKTGWIVCWESGWIRKSQGQHFNLHLDDHEGWEMDGITMDDSVG